MRHRQGRFSKYMKPLFGLVDLLVIIGVIFLFQINLKDVYLFIAYIIFLWVAISFRNKFYEVQRHTRLTQLIPLLIIQFVFFTIIVYAFIGFFKQPNMSRLGLASYLTVVFIAVSSIKILTYFLLKRYRSVLSGNIRNVIVIGSNSKAKQLIDIFDTRLDYGYKFKKQFSINDEGFIIENCFDYVISNDIDEIYFSVAELSNRQINQLIDFAATNLRELRFIPDNKDIFSKKLKYEYYDYIPILSLRNIPIKKPINKLLKRGFDIVFSLFIITFILSWLTPLIAILIKLESKGPVFFKQTRNGINNEEFSCYKFRSMTPNKKAHLKQATKGDLRVTKVGRLIRKTSIDELPQFYNVLFGDMSVVGPRPHMVSHTNMYAKRINKFMVRQFVKPGITGLAPTRGFRGEVATAKAIIGLVK